MTDTITVECPYCGHRFDTHDCGDLVACPECDETFSRFANTVGEDGSDGHD